MDVFFFQASAKIILWSDVRCHLFSGMQACFLWHLLPGNFFELYRVSWVRLFSWGWLQSNSMYPCSHLSKTCLGGFSCLLGQMRRFRWRGCSLMLMSSQVSGLLMVSSGMWQRSRWGVLSSLTSSILFAVTTPSLLLQVRVELWTVSFAFVAYILGCHHSFSYRAAFWTQCPPKKSVILTIPLLLTCGKKASGMSNSAWGWIE